MSTWGQERELLDARAGSLINIYTLFLEPNHIHSIQVDAHIEIVIGMIH